MEYITKILNTLRGKTMEQYIIYQMQIDKQEIIGSNHNTEMSTLVRLVSASSHEEAIGKFIIESQAIPAIKKIAVECIKLSELKTL